MTIPVVKQQPGSWQNKSRKKLTFFTRISASEWDELFGLANELHCSTRHIIREAIREYIANHYQQRGEELSITVRGSNGEGILKKIVHSVFGTDAKLPPD